MNNTISITPARNGFIVSSPIGTFIYATLDDVLSYLLLYFEGRAKTFTGTLYGCVTITREQDTEAQ